VPYAEVLAGSSAARLSPASKPPRLFWPGESSPEFASRLAGLEILQRPPPSGSYWWFEAADGTAFDFPGTLVRAWEKPPFSMLLRLVCNSPARRILAEAVIGTRSGLAELQAKAADTAVILLRGAMGNPARSLNDRRDAPPGLAPRSAIPATLGGYGRRLAHRMLDKLLVEEWGIGLVDQRLADLVRGEKMRSISWLRHDRRVNLADPHPWPGTDRILCEEFGFAGEEHSALGRIVAFEVDRGQQGITGKRLILGNEQHRSYPGTTVDGSDVLLLPETPSPGGTKLYRLDESGALDELCQVAPGLGGGGGTPPLPA
jgi:hypothetical protein